MTLAIPLIVFFACYLIVVIAFLSVSAIGLYHLRRFGFADRETTLPVIAFLVLGMGILAGTFVALLGVDWQQSIEVLLPFTVG